MEQKPNKQPKRSSSESFKVRIKVCGVTLPAQLEAFDEMGVDLAGFIFYPKSPRYVVNKISADYLRKFRGRIAKVGVFVNTPYEELMRTVEDYRLDMIQLHGDEIPRYCEQVANYITVVKAFRLSENDPIEWMAKPYEDLTCTCSIPGRWLWGHRKKIRLECAEKCNH
jgi:phosphoribosylanthranilate isomerase